MNFGSGFFTAFAAEAHPLNANALAAVEMKSLLLIAIVCLAFL